ncbi:MAG: hypothetical protein JWR00_1807, partial [Rubritepida sp.]|nr:hypothetical protein [Rubritepida sp.]
GGRSSGVEHDLAKVGVEGSNPFARSSLSPHKLLSSIGTALRSRLAALRRMTLM